MDSLVAQNAPLHRRLCLDVGITLLLNNFLIQLAVAIVYRLLLSEERAVT